MTDAPQEQQGAPKPPAWLIIAGEPRPLLDVNDERWIAQARRLDDPTVEGVLIYEEHKALCFLTPEEAIGALLALLGWSEELILQCQEWCKQDRATSLEMLLALHTPDVSTGKTLIETALLKSTDQDQEPEGSR